MQQRASQLPQSSCNRFSERLSRIRSILPPDSALNYASEASVSFERQGRTLSIAAAIVVAFVLPVDAFGVFRAFLRDPAIAAAVIAHKDNLTRSFDPARADPRKGNTCRGRDRPSQPRIIRA